jgi:hypothetical protein
MTQTSEPAGLVDYFYTNPNTGEGVPCTVLAQEDGEFLVRLPDDQMYLVTAGELYCQDESGRYLGGPR